MNPWDPQSARVYPDDGVWHSLNANENGGQSRDAVFCLQGTGIDRADTAGCNGSGWRKDVSYTLNTVDRPAIAFTQNQRDEVRDLGDVAGSLAAESGMKQQTYVVAGFSYGQGAKARSIGYQEEVSPTIRSGEGSNQKPCVYDARGNGNGEIVPTITGDHQSRVTDYTAICVGNGQLNQMSMAEQANTLDTMHDQQAVLCTAIDCSNGTESNVNGTLQAKSNGGTSLNLNNVCRQNQVVRRLTPLECERLQGFPDGWTDIGEWVDSKGKRRKTTDSARYRALGNSIALPFWQWLARRICAQYERTVTMGSLFDGIAGFPLVFSRSGAVPVWTSEIEEFPVAVVKKHFGDEGAGIKGDFYGSVNGE